MITAILFIVITSTAYASPVHIELRDIASIDAPVITVRCCYYCRTLNNSLCHFQKRLVRRAWTLSKSQDSLGSTQYEVPLGLPNEIDFKDLDPRWKDKSVLAEEADSQLGLAYLKGFDSEIAELKKPNAVMKRIKISGDRTSKQFKSRWHQITKELGLLQQLYGDKFVWGHSEGLDKVYIAVSVGRNKRIHVPKVSGPSQRMALPEVKQFIQNHRKDHDL